MGKPNGSAASPLQVFESMRQRLDGKKETFLRSPAFIARQGGRTFSVLYVDKSNNKLINTLLQEERKSYDPDPEDVDRYHREIAEFRQRLEGTYGEAQLLLFLRDWKYLSIDMNKTSKASRDLLRTPFMVTPAKGDRTPCILLGELDLSGREDVYASWSIHGLDKLGPVEQSFIDALDSIRGRSPTIEYKSLTSAA